MRDDSLYRKSIDAITDALNHIKNNCGSKPLRWQDEDYLIEKNSDGEYLPETGQIIQCEFLLCFLLPLNQFKKNKELSKRIFDIIPKKELASLTYKLVKELDEIDVYGGRPYIYVKDDSNNEYPFIDTICYTLSIIVLSEKVFGTPRGSEDKKNMRKCLEKCLKFLKDSICISSYNFLAKGWSFTNRDVPDRPFKYTTWMVTDTLSDVVNIKDIESKFYWSEESRNHIRDLKAHLRTVLHETLRIYVNGEHTKLEEELFDGRNVLITKRQVQEDLADQGWNYNIWLILTLIYLRYENESDLLDALNMIYETMSDSSDILENQTKNKCVVKFETEKMFTSETDDKGRYINKLVDRSFLSQFAKSFSLFGLYSDYSEDVNQRVEKCIEWLLDNRKENIPAWDAHAEKGDFIIYQTERAIEALCIYLKYFEKHSKTIDENEVSESLNDKNNTINSSNLVECFERMADTISARAVSININGKSAGDLIKHEVEEYLQKNLQNIFSANINDIIEEIANAKVTEIISKLDMDDSIGDRAKEIQEMYNKIKLVASEE